MKKSMYLFDFSIGGQRNVCYAENLRYTVDLIEAIEKQQGGFDFLRVVKVGALKEMVAQPA